MFSSDKRFLERIRPWIEDESRRWQWRIEGAHNGAHCGDDGPCLLLLGPDFNLERLPEVCNDPVSSVVLARGDWSSRRIEALFPFPESLFLIDTDWPTGEGNMVLMRAAKDLSRRIEKNRLMERVRSQNRRILEINQNLEAIVKERTQSEVDAKKDLQLSGEALSEVILFIKDLAGVKDIPEVLHLLKREVRRYHRMQDPVLLVRRPGLSQIYYVRGGEVIEKSVALEPDTRLRIRVHDAQDSQFLANQLGRPVGRVVSFPLSSHQQDRVSFSPILFFEHRLEEAELDRFIKELGERLQAISLTLDRILLERDLKFTATIWERTFDGLGDPIVVVDLDGQVVRANKHFATELLEQRPSDLIKAGNKLFRLEEHPVRLNDGGPVLSWVHTYADVTRATRLREKMIQLEKMSAIGHLAGHIAHELNNPLTGIRSLAQLLIADLLENDPVRADLQEVETAAARCQNIIVNLLDFSKGTLDEKSRTIDLNQLVLTTLPFLKSALSRSRSDVDLSDEPVPVHVEPQLMKQVIFNLVNNACQAVASEERGDVHIRTRRREEDGRAVLEVEDSGPGVDPEILPHIFEPFFTTKDQDHGTGLGLSFSRDFLRRFGGDIECMNGSDRGARFRVTIPLKREKE